MGGAFRKAGDQLGNEVKYGGGPALIKQLLDESSRLVAGAETTMAENGILHDVLLSLGQAARQLAQMAKQNE